MVIRSGSGKAGVMWKHPSASTGLPEEVITAAVNGLINTNEELCGNYLRVPQVTFKMLSATASLWHAVLKFVHTCGL